MNKLYWFEGKNSSRRIGTELNYHLDNETWGYHLANVPLARNFRDGDKFTYGDLLNAILSTTNRREQLAMIAVASYVWDRDCGYGSAPKDTTKFVGNDL